MQEIEVIYKNIVCPKLTVTPTRVTVKLPTDYKDNPEHDVVLNGFLEFAKEIGIPKNAMRGQLKDGCTHLNMRYKRSNAPYSKQIRLLK